MGNRASNGDDNGTGNGTGNHSDVVTVRRAGGCRRACDHPLVVGAHFSCSQEARLSWPLSCHAFAAHEMPGQDARGCRQATLIGVESLLRQGPKSPHVRMGHTSTTPATARRRQCAQGGKVDLWKWANLTLARSAPLHHAQPLYKVRAHAQCFPPIGGSMCASIVCARLCKFVRPKFVQLALTGAGCPFLPCDCRRRRLFPP